MSVVLIFTFSQSGPSGILGSDRKQNTDCVDGRVRENWYIFH